MTPRGEAGFIIRFGLLLACLALAAVNTGNNLLYLVFSLMIAVVAVAWVLASRALGRVETRLQLPEEVIAGRPFLLGLEASAREGRFPSPWLHASIRGLPGRVPGMDLPGMAPGGRTVVCSSARVDRRGIHGNLSVDVSTSYPFGLFKRRRRLAQGAALVVTPRRFEIRSLSFPSPEARGSTGSTRPGEGTDLYNIRDYTPVDDARRIDWKASARVNRPMLREFERELQRSLDLVLDERPAPGAPAGAFDAMVETAASILDHCGETGIRVRLLVAGDGAAACALEERAALVYLAAAEPRSGRLPHLYGPARQGAARVVLSLNPKMATPFKIEWCDAKPSAGAAP